MSDDVVIALDVGTTSAKAVAFDADGHEHGSDHCGYPLNEPRRGEAEQDPDEVVAAALGVVRSVAGAVRPAAIALCTAMHSLVGLDAEGRPLTSLITWADGRAAEQAERLRARYPELHERTGTPLHPMAPLAKLVWWRENDPERFARVHRWVSIKELLVHRLTGDWLIDASCASGTGLMACATLDWDEQALEIARVRREQLCPIVPSTQVRELTSSEVGLPAGTPVVIGAGDGPLANLGLGAVGDGVAACSIGTSGALRLMVSRPGIDPQRSLFSYALTDERWVLGGAINNGGSVLHWAGTALAPDLGPHPEHALLEQAAQVPAGSEGLIMLPYLFSERAPHWSALPRGAYVGLRHFHGRGHLVRAAIEGVCQQLALVLDSIRDAGHEVREIRATGGFARSEWWRQLVCDVFAMPVGFTSGPEGSALGAALLGLQALGIIESLDRASDLVAIAERRDPDDDAAAVYADTRPMFAHLYDQLTPAFRELAAAERRQPDLAPTRQRPT